MASHYLGPTGWIVAVAQLRDGGPPGGGGSETTKLQRWQDAVATCPQSRTHSSSCSGSKMCSAVAVWANVTEHNVNSFSREKAVI